ncbi:MAG: hypothetical protein ACJ76B_11085 [Solirubrobacterales bacterium]
MLIFFLASLFLLGGVDDAFADDCPNAAARTGPSALLEDCRAYELVTPADTVNRPQFLDSAPSGGFSTPTANASGDEVLFAIRGEALRGTDGTGSGDRYLSTRGDSGWASRLAGPTGAQAENADPGGSSANYGQSFWQITAPGASSRERVLRHPDGSLSLLGDGSLTDDRAALGRWISPNGEHVIFTSEKKLEADAPDEVGCCTFNYWAGVANEPVNAVYEWTSAGPEVLSLLPGGVTPAPESVTYYWGASKDGSSVVFTIGERFFGEEATMYVRRGGVTYPMVDVPWAEEAIFMGASDSGDKIFYLVSPNIFFGATTGSFYVYDVTTEESEQISTASDVGVINVSADGSHAYFVSEEQLDAPEGTPGALNFYVWNGTDIEFITELTQEDVYADPAGTELRLIDWPLAVSSAQQATIAGPGIAPSRSTSDGSAMAFEARSNLTGYDSEGHRQVYRYSAADDELKCVSCDPSGDPPTADAQLQGVSHIDRDSPTPAPGEVRSLTENGSAVFYVTANGLVQGDDDGKVDVYEWKEDDIALISYGHSGGTNEWLYGVSPTGRDVFFTSADRLVPEKTSDSVSIYDARINGGFPRQSSPIPCAIGDCQGVPSPPTQAPAIGTANPVGAGNVKPRPRPRPCKKLKGKKKKRCLRTHSKKRNSNKNRSAKNNRRAG